MNLGVSDIVLIKEDERNFAKRICEILGSEEEYHYIYIKVYLGREIALANTPYLTDI